MKKVRTLMVAALMGWSVMLVGCTPSEEEMAKMLEQPPRPAELERLEAFIGNWSGDATVKIKGVDETSKSSGKNTTKWAADKWLLVEHWEHDMGEDNRIKGVSMTWWDAKSKKYRSSWSDSYGGAGNGTMKYNEQTGVWHFSGKSKDGKTGQKTIGEGTMKFTNPSTMKWSYSEYDGMKMIKFVEATGTSKRQ